jgi:hemolysin activation/secretion protein
MKKIKTVTQCMLALMIVGLPTLAAREKPAEQFEQQRQLDAKAQREASESAVQKKSSATELAKAKLPEDTSARLSVKEIRFEGNTFVSTQELIAGMPDIFNASNVPMAKAESKDLYDFRVVKEIISSPGTAREVSARTLQGLTQYVLSIYQQKNYGGIYVYVPAEILSGGEVKDGIVVVDVLESRVSNVGIKYFDPNQKVVEKGYLDPNAVLSWSPVKQGQPVNRKRLDDFVNLLNLDPDRYVTAVVSKGSEPNTLAVSYDIYEVNPWHYFIQLDNSGVEGREWNPKFGVINTNLLGFDDSFFAVYQVPLDSGWEDNYSLFGSYDFPLWSQDWRLNIFGGYSEFNLNPNTSDFDFVGSGNFIGANLKYTFLQTNGWFFDAIGSISEEESETTPFFGSLALPEAGSQVRMDLWGAGIDIHKRDDIAISSMGYKFSTLMSGSSEEQFNRSRLGADNDFTINTIYASHSRVLDPNQVTRLSTTFKWIFTDERLTPAKMTPFGGMYSVRGYKEYEILADGGILASAQYEFDLVRYEKLKEVSKEQANKEQAKQTGLKKFAPLVFTDFGRTKINDPRSEINDKSHETLWSAGIGALAEYGNNLSAAVYYGIALRDTERTDAGDGRVNVSFMLRW